MISSVSSESSNPVETETLWSSGEATTQTQAEPVQAELILGKFKTQDDLIKSYEGLQKAMSGKFDDDTLRNMAVERGLITVAPEAYTGLTEIAEQHNLNTESPGLGTFQDLARKHNLSQEAAVEFLNAHAVSTAEGVEYALNMYGVDTRPKAEKIADLKKQTGWGNDFDSNMKAIEGWAINEYGQQFANYLASHPLGIMFMHSERVKKADPAPINDSDRDMGQTAAELDAEIKDLMKSEAYWDAGHIDNKSTRTKVDALLKRQFAAKGAVR